MGHLPNHKLLSFMNLRGPKLLPPSLLCFSLSIFKPVKGLHQKLTILVVHQNELIFTVVISLENSLNFLCRIPWEQLIYQPIIPVTIRLHKRLHHSLSRYHILIPEGWIQSRNIQKPAALTLVYTLSLYIISATLCYCIYFLSWYFFKLS